MNDCFFEYVTPVGKLYGFSRDAVEKLYFSDSDGYFPTGEPFKRSPHVTDAAAKCLKWLEVYFSGKNPAFTPDVELHGSPFRLEVWNLLKTIPYGETVCYGDIAKAIAERHGMTKMSAQAVGGAVGANPVSVIVPCHRVIGSDKTLVGYGGGLERKVFLLGIEGVKIEDNKIIDKIL